MARRPGVALMKVVVLAGPESSGKSWLAAQLHAYFGGVMVGEYVRHFIDHHQRDTTLADIPAIAHGQLAWEDSARARHPALLILDTHLLTNRLWSQTLFGDYPGWLDDELLARQYDLHLLLSPRTWNGAPMASAASRNWPTAGRFSRPAWSGCKSINSRWW